MPGGGKAGGSAAVLEILGESAARSEPGESPFHDPFSGDDLEAERRNRSFDDFSFQVR